MPSRWKWLVGFAVVAAIAVSVVAGLSKTGKPTQLWTNPEGQQLAVVQAPLADGNIVVTEGASRFYAYSIGSVIPVHVVVATSPRVLVDFETLLQGQLTQGNTDFEIVGAVKITHTVEKGANVYTIDMTLRSFMPQAVLPLSFDFFWSPVPKPGGTPQWTQISTPVLPIGWAQTAPPNATMVIQGNLDPVGGEFPLSAVPFFIVGGAFVLLLLGAALKWAWRRLNPMRKLSDNERIWLELDQILADTRYSGFRTEHYKRIADVLRTYLDVSSMTYGEIAEARAADPGIELVLDVLQDLDQELYGNSTLSDDERNTLVERLTELVPRTPPPAPPREGKLRLPMRLRRG